METPGTRTDMIAQLRATLGKMEVALGTIRESIAWTDDAGRVEWCNDSFTRLAGLPRIRLLGRPVTDFFPLLEHDQLLPSPAHPVSRVLKNGNTVTGLYTFRDKDRVRHLEVSVEEVRFQSDSRSAVLVARDVTEARELEQVRLQSLALQAAENAIVITDREGRVLWANQAMSRLTGYSLDDLYGNDLSLLKSGRQDQRYYMELWETVLAGNPWAGRLINRHKDGHLYHEEQTITPVPDAHGDVAYFIAIKEDVTRRVAAQEELKRSMALAESASRAKSEFLAGMSHEIRTPMNTIIGIGDLLLETNLEEEQRRFVTMLQKAGDNLLSLINDILDLSKVEAGKVDLEEAPFDLSDLLTSLCEGIEVQTAAKGLRLSCPDSYPFPVRLSGDVARLRQVLLNLFSNAVKFTKQGEVALEVRRITPGLKAPLTLLFIVRDTGIGIPADKVRDVFGAFTQADASVTKKYGGTGLGLSISKGLVRLMNGRIWVRSREGRGTVFYVLLPFQTVSEIEGESGDACRERPDLTGKTALIVDDLRENRVVLSSMLGLLGVSCREADGPSAALQMLEQAGREDRLPDMIFIDNLMPGMNGFDLTRTLRTRPEFQGRPLFIVSSDQSSGEAREAREHGASGYLRKPFKRAELYRMICSGISGWDSSPDLSEEVLEVLVVDDHPDNLLLMKAFLKKTPHRVTTAGDGREAVDMVRDHRFDLIFMDMQMPVLDGYSATREIRTMEAALDLPPVPIIALTAYAMQEDREKTLAAGCTEHMSKPVRKKALLELLARYS